MSFGSLQFTEIWAVKGSILVIQACLANPHEFGFSPQELTNFWESLKK